MYCLSLCWLKQNYAMFSFVLAYRSQFLWLVLIQIPCTNNTKGIIAFWKDGTVEGHWSYFWYWKIPPKLILWNSNKSLSTPLCTWHFLDLLIRLTDFTIIDSCFRNRHQYLGQLHGDWCRHLPLPDCSQLLCQLHHLLQTGQQVQEHHSKVLHQAHRVQENESCNSLAILSAIAWYGCKKESKTGKSRPKHQWQYWNTNKQFINQPPPHPPTPYTLQVRVRFERPKVYHTSLNYCDPSMSSYELHNNFHIISNIHILLSLYIFMSNKGFYSCLLTSTQP